MLALKTLSVDGDARASASKTLIFDEVDAGIGGRVATVVGQKLASLGERFQVLCITHLPQIAAAGRTHFLIEKRVESRRTVTHVARLSAEDRIAEIARMMGGTAAGEKVQESARELLAASGAKAKGERRKSPQTAQKTSK
jgi:DNA repair protein RecN (Recombination protein N)